MEIILTPDTQIHSKTLLGMKILKYQCMELSSKRFSVVFPEFRQVASFVVQVILCTLQRFVNQVNNTQNNRWGQKYILKIYLLIITIHNSSVHKVPFLLLEANIFDQVDDNSVHSRWQISFQRLPFFQTTSQQYD